jgi:hypothetical protein
VSTTAPTSPARTTRAGVGPRDRLPVVSPLSRPPLRALLACLLLLVSSVAWRKGAYFSGSLDVVVVAKASLSIAALALAATAPARGTPWSRFPVGPLPLLAIYLGISTVGAALHDSGLPTMVLASRVVIVAATAVLLVHAFPAAELLTALTSAMLLLAGFASVTGIGSLASSGRLYGGLPPISANEISLLVSVPLLCILWRCVSHRATWADVAAILPCVGVIWLTGTRTGLVALVLSVIVLVLMAPRIPVPVMCAGLLAVPSTLFVVFLTPVVSTYATRDSTSLLTLNSRTVAWRAAFEYIDGWHEQVLGVGLAVKEIPVSAMYRTDQILDSTWVSAYVQAGVAGTAVLVLLLLTTVVRVAGSRPPVRSLSAALLLLVVSRSLLESGLFDATPAGITFVIVALSLQRSSPEDGP